MSTGRKIAVTVLTLLIAFGLLLAGEIIGELSMFPLRQIIDSPDIRFLFMYLSFWGIIAAVFLYTYLRDRDIFNSFGPKSRGGLPGNGIKELLIGFLIGFGMNILCALAALLHGDIKLSFGTFHPVFLILGIIFVLIQSSAEEILDRGYLQYTFARYMPPWAVALIVSLFFGSLHLANPGMTPLAFTNIVLVGVLYSLMVYYNGSLWMVCGAHTSWNYTQNLLLGLPNSGIVSESSLMHLDAASDSWVYSVNFGIEGAWPATILYVAGIVIVWFLLKEKNKENQ